MFSRSSLANAAGQQLSQVGLRFIGSVALTFAALLPAAAQDQPTVEIGASYEFIAPTLVTRYHFKKQAPLAGQTEIARTGTEFRIVDDRNGVYVIRFFRWANSPDNNTRFVDSTLTTVGAPIESPPPPTKTRPLFFAIPKEEFARRVTRVYATGKSSLEITGGAVVIPVKMRLKPFDFSRDFSLGFAAGPRWRLSRRKEHYFMVPLAFNVTIVGVDSVSTNGKAKEPTDLGALGAAVGGVVDFNGIQMGLFVGKDWISMRDRLNTGWIYHRKTWISAGLGFTIFTRSSNNTAQSGTQSSTAAK